MTGNRPPTYVRRFCDVLRGVTLDHMELPIARPPITGHRGILHTSKIWYNEQPWNFLNRNHEYTFYVAEKRVELSMQLYLNETNYWRLFCFCGGGGARMLLSLNLTLLRGTGQSFTLNQHLHITTQDISKAERSRRGAKLCATLTRLGLEIDPSGHLVLGTFDSRAGRLLDTTPRAFIRDFALASLVKGHFMGNKGYRLPGLPEVSTQWTTTTRSMAVGRSISLRLRYEVLERARRRCMGCLRGVQDGIRLHVDHIVPYSLGGRTELNNLQALCQDCNTGKGNRSSRRLG